MSLLLHWLIYTMAIGITAWVLPGVRVSGFFAAFFAAAVLGLINSIIRPVLVFLTLPITIVTLGLFTLVINALLVMLTSTLVRGFDVSGFWWAVAFGIILSFVNYFLHLVFG